MKMLPFLACAVSLLSAAAGCDDSTPIPAPDTVADASSEVSLDGSDDADTAVDAEPDAGPTRVDLTWPVTERGPYNAGHRTVEVTYAPTGLGAGAERTLVLHLFYPTEASTGEAPKYIGLFEFGYSFEDAALAAPAVGERYPLHIFSHGHQGFAGATSRNLTHLASHGWVVAAPDHTGNLLTDGGDRDNAIYFLRSQDMSAVLDYLADMPAADVLAGTLDTTNTVLSGHSFGGYTAFTVGGAQWDLAKLATDCAAGGGFGGEPCTPEETAAFQAGAKDPRVKGIVPMAAGDRNKFGADGLAQIDVPVLMMTGDDDDSLSPQMAADIWGLLPAGSAWVDIAGACHQTFAIGGCQKLADAPGYDIVDAYLLAFSRAHVLGDASVGGFLDGSITVAPEVTFQKK